MNSEKRTDLWPWYKEILARIETALVAGQPASRARLELVLKEAENDFKNLLENPGPNPTDSDSLRKAVTDGIKLQGWLLQLSHCPPLTVFSEGQDNLVTLSQSLVEEALIVSDLFKLNELSSLHLLLHGEEQLPQYPGLTRGNIPLQLLLSISSHLLPCRPGGRHSVL